MDWTPLPNYCHDNSDRYSGENEGFRSVRGWRIFDYSISGYFKFISHSVIADPNGRLFEITPSPGAILMPKFLSTKVPRENSKQLCWPVMFGWTIR